MFNIIICFVSFLLKMHRCHLYIEIVPARALLKKLEVVQLLIPVQCNVVFSVIIFFVAAKAISVVQKSIWLPYPYLCKINNCT